MAMLSNIEKLATLYMNLERQEAILASQLAEEQQANRRYLKPSKTTKYNISIIKRAIGGRERLINHAAEKYQDWLYRDIELRDKINEAEVSKQQSEYEINNLMLQLTMPTSTLQMDKLRVELSHHGTIVLECTKELKSLITQHIKHRDNKPPVVKAVNKKEILAQFDYISAEEELPEALEPIAKKAREKSPMDLEIEEILNRPIQQREEIAIDKSADTDVSFLFADYKESNETLQSSSTAVECDNQDVDMDTSDNLKD